MTHPIGVQLVKEALLSEEFASDVAGTAGAVTVTTGLAAGGGAGLYAHKALSEESLQELAKRLSRRLRVPASVAIGLATGLVAAKSIGLPAGLLFGTARAGGRRREPLPPPPPPRKSAVDYALGR